jgi:exodeoxyribonuclease V alpha subunit
VPRAIAWYEEQERFQLAPDQRSALERALTAKVLVITGGPGTGKTTLVKGIVSILTRKRQRLLLAAPTGRAAKRLSEATGQEARTVHRLLEYSPMEHGFARGLDHPLAADLLVIDEASMLDTTLTHHVLKAVPQAARLILVGDVDQLPSIGPGRVLADIIDSGAVEVVRLQEIFRQARQSLIVTNAHRIRSGQVPITSPEEGGDFFVVEREAPEAILSTLKQVVADRIPRHLGLDPKREIQVLTPMRRGLLGSLNLNAELQALLNPEGDTIPLGNRPLHLGDRVMQRRNNYDLEVWNGDIGRVKDWDEVEQRLQIDFDGRMVSYERAELDELVLAYACSIHKSQGSEYPCVVIPLHTQHYTLLERNLLYTAITRGRRMVMVIASRRALELAVKTTNAHRRLTRLAERLRGTP